jgi:PEP-CTERM motif
MNLGSTYYSKKEIALMISNKNSLFALLAIGVMLVASASATAGTVSFVETFDQYVDVFLTPSPGSEFLNFDVEAIPAVGQILDPTRNLAGNAGDYDNVTDGARVDTWANTAYSSLGAGVPSYIFTEYVPGSPPFTPSDPLPSAGGTPGALRWSVFDTQTGDTDQFGPYHIARIMYSQGGSGVINILAYDTITADTGGEFFSTPYGIPEPGTLVLAGMGLIGIVTGRRRLA